jgi:sodium/proline symporter
MLFVLVLFAAVFFGLAWRAGSRIVTTRDYFLANRALPAWQAGLSQASNALPPWLLAGIAAAAFAWGFAAIWILIAVLAGHLIGWFFVAPRVHQLAVERSSGGLLPLLTGDTGTRMRGPVMLSSVLIFFLALLIGMAAWLPMLGAALARFLPVTPTTAMLLALGFATLSALVGGYPGICRNDSLRSLLLFVAAVVVAVAGLVAAGGWAPVWENLKNLPVDVGLWTGEPVLILAVTFVLGTLVLSVAPYGQPQVIARLMTYADQPARDRAWRMALLWMMLITVSLLVCGWTARLVMPVAVDGDVLLPLLAEVLPAGIAAVVAAAFLVGAVGSLESGLLAMAAAVSVDLYHRPLRPSLDWPKPAVVLSGALLAAVALFVPEPSFERLVLAWTLLGAAFGPLLLVRLTGKRVRPGSMAGSMWAGFMLTLLLHLLPNAPGDFLERALPFVAALGIALTGGERRRDPDRADRSQQAATGTPETPS